MLEQHGLESEKKVYVLSLVDILDVKERKQDKEVSRRRRFMRYHLKKNDERVPVCIAMFLNTLGIGKRTVYFWVDHADSEIPRKLTEREKAAPGSSKNRFCNRILSVYAQDAFPLLPINIVLEYLEPTCNSSAEQY